MLKKEDESGLDDDIPGRLLMTVEECGMEMPEPDSLSFLLERDLFSVLHHIEICSP